MAESIHRVFSLRLREERRSAGLTLEELAEKAGITGAFIAHIEAQRKRPTLETIEKLAQALGLSVATLLSTAQDGDTADKRWLERFARYIAPLRPDEKEALLKLVRVAAELVQR